ncbi:MAG: serine/threonine-protein phosphatase, partial [Oscillochloris sp.]|nr:serine/threonine-protein phosphatase [Oscillochloris sp.]
HCPPAIVGAGGIKSRLGPTGPVVGIFPDAQFELAQTVLDPGDTLFCYTDGVTDVRSPERQFFGEARTLDLLTAPPASTGDLLSRVEARVQAHIASAHQFDDITMLALGRRLPGADEA